MMRGAWMVPLVLLALTAPVQARVKCSTPDHRRWQRFTYFSNADRPSKPNVARSTSGRVSVHWDPAEVTEAHAHLAMQILEDALQREVDQMGWPAPIPDRTYGGDAGLDLYFDPQPDGSAYTAPDPEDPGLHRDAAMAYIVLDTATLDEDLPSFIYHECNHVLQFGADPGEANSIFEATASFMEYLTVPESVVNTGYLPAFQGAPTDAMDDFTHTDEYEYGYSLFLFFISQRYFNGAPEIIRDLWVGSAQLSTGATYHNEPDYLDVLQTRLPDVPLTDVMAEFSRWRSFMGRLDDGMHVVLPGTLPPGSAMSVTATVTASSGLPYSKRVSLAETGSALFLVNVDGAFAMGGVRADVLGGTAGTEEAEVSLLSTAAANAVVRSAHARGPNPTVALGTQGATQIRVVLARLGDGAHDPDDEEWSKTTYTLTLTAVDAPDAGDLNADAGNATVDAGNDDAGSTTGADAGALAADAGGGSGGDAPPPDKQKGCGGCGASEASPLGLVWLAWVLRPARRRR